MSATRSLPLSWRPTLQTPASPGARVIASNCDWLSEHAARDFWEALQSLWFLFVLLQIESNASSFSPGRFDQYMLPYLEADLREGRLTLPRAQELLESLWIKFNEIVLLRSSASARYYFMEYDGPLERVYVVQVLGE